MVAITRLASIREPEAAGGWLHAVLRNACLMRIRQSRHEIPADQLDVLARAPGPEQVLEQHALRDWICTALEVITEEERLTLILRHFTRCHTIRRLRRSPGSRWARSAAV